VIESPNPIYQRWADESKVPTPDVTLRVIEEPCPGTLAKGCTIEDSYAIWLDLTFTGRHRATFLHELGHNFDYYELDDWARVAFADLYGEWNKEAFAESYRFCARDINAWGRRLTGMTRRAQDGACRLIRLSARQ
jgi:hypothetical protein